MKYSETSESDRAKRLEYVSKRWEQLSTRGDDATENLVKYVFLVNAGSAAAALSFIGAVERVRGFEWAYTALVLFMCGVLFIGAFRLYRFHRLEWLFAKWRSDTNRWRRDEIEWNELLDADAARYKFNALSVTPYVLGYASLGCFCAGLWVTTTHFHELLDVMPKEQKHERTTDPTPPAKTTPTRASSETGSSAPAAPTGHSLAQ